MRDLVHEGELRGVYQPPHFYPPSDLRKDSKLPFSGLWLLLFNRARQ